MEVAEQPRQALGAHAQTAARPGLYLRGGKRAMDVMLSAIALITLSPLFLLIAILIKLTSPGPVLYRQRRAGREGRTFRVVKFRSMEVDSERLGPNITVATDPRITRLGQILRLWKLDELPQLFNVLKGEMSLVGPRPELPTYVATYSQSQRTVLSIRPGLTDPASIAYHGEENLLARQSDPVRFYREVVLPHKLALSREYVKGITLRRDLALIVRTLLLVPSNEPQPE